MSEEFRACEMILKLCKNEKQLYAVGKRIHADQLIPNDDKEALRGVFRKCLEAIKNGEKESESTLR